MKLYTKEMLIEAINLAQSFKPSDIVGNFSATGLYQIDDILEILDKKYFSDVFNADGVSFTKEDIYNSMKKLIEEDKSNKFKTAISYKVNDKEELKKILNGEK